jgi:hypothetical protein
MRVIRSPLRDIFYPWSCIPSPASLSIAKFEKS